MSTKSFIISLPIITGDQDRRRLRKSFSFGCNLQNAVMGGGWDRVPQLRATPEWQAARGAMPKGRERTKAFRDLRVRFRLSEYDFHADVAKHRKASGRGHLLGINECQKLASRAWISVERHLYNGGSPRFISSRRGLHSIEGKTNRTGIIWKADQQCVTVCKRVYRVRVDKRDDWLTRALQDPTDPTKPRKVKYCLLSHAGSIIVEDNSFKAFQKGHFGKSIGRHAPAAFYTQLTSKAESAGLRVTVVSPRKLKPSQHNLLTDTFVKHELWERRVRLGNEDDDRWIDRDAAACLNLLYADLEKQTYAPERIREAVLAGVTAWLDAGVVVIQAREGITEREFGRFRRRGIPSLTVQGLRQQGFRGRTDSKSGTTPRRKASTVSKPSHFSGEVV